MRVFIFWPFRFLNFHFFRQWRNFAQSNIYAAVFVRIGHVFFAIIACCRFWFEHFSMRPVISWHSFPSFHFAMLFRILSLLSHPFWFPISSVVLFLRVRFCPYPYAIFCGLSFWNRSRLGFDKRNVVIRYFYARVYAIHEYCTHSFLFCQNRWNCYF